MESGNNSHYSTENHIIEITVLLVISILAGILSAFIWNKD